MWPTRISNFIETFHFIVMGDQPGKHHISAGIAVSHGDMGIIKPQGLGCETIHHRGGSFQFTTIDSNRITAHIIHGDEKKIEWFLFFGV